MKAADGGSGPTENGDRGRERIALSLPRDLAEQLAAFCREKGVQQDMVVERALIEYFREGDVSH